MVPNEKSGRRREAGTPKKKPRKPRPKPLPTAETRLRVDDVFGLVLAGARTEAIYKWVREERSDWNVSTRQVDRYIREAKTLLFSKLTTDQAEEKARHRARLDDLFFRHYASGDFRGALATAQETAKLEDLYPPRRSEVSGPGGGPIETTYDLSKLTTEELELLVALTEKAGAGASDEA